MTSIFITGSTEGLGYLTAKNLIESGNDVTLHARNQQRANDVSKKLQNAKHIVIGDLSNRKDVDSIANQVNDLGTFDTVIYNAGVSTSDTDLTFKVNVIAPYLLTTLINRPKRIVYVSSGMHKGARLDINNLPRTTDYSSSKLQVLLLTKIFAKQLPDTIVTAVDPGWVPTGMGGSMATDDLTMGYTSQVKLATTNDHSITGSYFYHLKPDSYDQRADDIDLQRQYLQKLQEITKR
ncbi:SDR family NAD(P)-dependent oxidoreductase [Companilactobacillus kimchiensis]|uniref:Daunorubicin C-13 ketoreductase n=1 Tax=Companilactobacillus kimchiensis TaxID=993692 RepID=A0A0R2LFF1_9LACO|nr:SDR family NAD(P)-dependent oxidoreductase [Companilactobacillus kimchiensis]KRO00597.1 daunorubicin C-13 ketoreductase [Companilactobacillus kimchiensis]